MAFLEEVLKGSPLPVIGLGVLGIVLPVVFPAMRPPLAAALKAGAKLFLEAEFEADDALAERLAEAAVDTLLQVTATGSEQDRNRKAEEVVSRFVSRARVGAHRRGRDRQDVLARYHRRLAKIDRSISRAERRAHASQHKALRHAAESLRKHSAEIKHETLARAGRLPVRPA